MRASFKQQPQTPIGGKIFLNAKTVTIENIKFANSLVKAINLKRFGRLVFGAKHVEAEGVLLTLIEGN